MGNIMFPQDFSRLTAPKQTWEAGQVRHITAVLKERRVAVVTDAFTGHIQDGVSLLRVAHHPFSTGYAVLLRSYWHTDAGPGHGDTWHSLFNLGAIIDLEALSYSKNEALRTYMDEKMSAVRVAQERHGEAEGRSWGAWSAKPLCYPGSVWVEYTPHVSNPAFKDRWGTPWSGEIQL